MNFFALHYLLATLRRCEPRGRAWEMSGAQSCAQVEVARNLRTTFTFHSGDDPPFTMLETETRKRPSQDPIAPPPTKKRALTGENGSPILVNGNVPATPSPEGDEPRDQDDLEVRIQVHFS